MLGNISRMCDTQVKLELRRGRDVVMFLEYLEELVEAYDMDYTVFLREI